MLGTDKKNNMITLRLKRIYNTCKFMKLLRGANIFMLRPLLEKKKNASAINLLLATLKIEAIILKYRKWLNPAELSAQCTLTNLKLQSVQIDFIFTH